MALELLPVNLSEANDYVTSFHRHNDAVRGAKFAVGATDGAYAARRLHRRGDSRLYDRSESEKRLFNAVCGVLEGMEGDGRQPPGHLYAG